VWRAVLAVTLAGVALGGCLGAKERAARAAAKDEAWCASVGVKPGDPQYVECRATAADLRIKEAAAEAEELREWEETNAALAKARKERLQPNPSPFSTYTINGQTYHCTTTGTSTSCY
jgi:hypothetical protein